MIVAEASRLPHCQSHQNRTAQSTESELFTCRLFKYWPRQEYVTLKVVVIFRGVAEGGGGVANSETVPDGRFQEWTKYFDQILITIPGHQKTSVHHWLFLRDMVDFFWEEFLMLGWCKLLRAFINSHYTPPIWKLRLNLSSRTYHCPDVFISRKECKKCVCFLGLFVVCFSRARSEGRPFLVNSNTQHHPHTADLCLTKE
jgi:hypothetical protein